MSANFDTYLYDQADSYMSGGLTPSGEEAWDAMALTIECRLFEIKDELRDLIRECRATYGFSKADITELININLEEVL